MHVSAVVIAFSVHFLSFSNFSSVVVLVNSILVLLILTMWNTTFTEELPSFEDHLHSLFKVVHVGPISTGIQSLMLLYQVMESRQSVSSRYYNALYSKLLDPAVKHCNRQVSGNYMWVGVCTGGGQPLWLHVSQICLLAVHVHKLVTGWVLALLDE